jgi:hypothetical protein
MTVQDLIDIHLFELKNAGDDPEREITLPFCCDLLSIAMGKAPAGCAWVTVMANINTLAVASLADAACIILAEGAVADDVTLAKAASQGITLFSTDLPIFDAALSIYNQLHSCRN